MTRLAYDAFWETLGYWAWQLIGRPLTWAFFSVAVPPMLFFTLVAANELWTWYLPIPAAVFVYVLLFRSLPDVLGGRLGEMSENAQLVEQLKDVPVIRVFAEKIVGHRAAGRTNHVTVYEDRLRDIISVVAHLSGRELSDDDAAQVIQGLVQRSEA